MGFSVQQRAGLVAKKCSLFVFLLKANRIKNLKLLSNRPSRKISMMRRHTVSTSANWKERATTNGKTSCVDLGRRYLVRAWIKSVHFSGMTETPRNAKINLTIAAWSCCNATAHYPNFRPLVVIRVQITYPNNLKKNAKQWICFIYKLFFMFLVNSHQSYFKVKEHD